MTNRALSSCQQPILVEENIDVCHKKDDTQNDRRQVVTELSYANAVRKQAGDLPDVSATGDQTILSVTDYEIEFGMTKERYDKALSHCKQTYTMLPGLRPITPKDKDAITLLIKGEIRLPTLPSFLWQCLTLHQIEQLTLVLEQQNDRHLFLPIPSSVHIEPTLTFYGILRQISPGKTAPKQLEVKHQQFVQDVKHVVFNQYANVLVFTLRNLARYKLWQGKEIFLRGSPSILKPFDKELISTTTKGRTLRINMDMNYSVTFLKVDTDISFSKLKHFLEERLSLTILKMDHAYHPISKTIDLTSWRVTFDSFECPTIFYKKTRVEVDGKIFYLKHDRFFLNAPCTTCFSARHSTRRCRSFKTLGVWKDNILSIDEYIFPVMPPELTYSLKACVNGHQFVQSLLNIQQGFRCPATPTEIFLRSPVPGSPVPSLDLEYATPLTSPVLVRSKDTEKVQPLQMSEQAVLKGVAKVKGSLNLNCVTSDNTVPHQTVPARLCESVAHSATAEDPYSFPQSPTYTPMVSPPVATDSSRSSCTKLSSSRTSVLFCHVCTDTVFHSICSGIDAYLDNSISILWYQKWFRATINISITKVPHLPVEDAGEPKEVKGVALIARPPMLAGPVFTLADQSQFLRENKRDIAIIPSNGHCLWMALYACGQSTNPFGKTTSARVAERFRSFKQSLYDTVMNFLPRDLDNIAFPAMTSITGSGSLSDQKQYKLKCIQDYFDAVISTPSTEHLDQRYWGSALAIELTTILWHEPIYVMEFKSGWGNSLLHRYMPQIVGPGLSFHQHVKYTLMPYSDWSSILSSPQHKILLYINQNHYNYLLPMTSVFEDLRVTKKNVYGGEVGATKQLSIGAFFQPVSTTTLEVCDENAMEEATGLSDPLEQQLQTLSTPVRRLARTNLDNLNIQDVYVQAQAKQLSPKSAACELESIAIVSAQKQYREVHPLTESSVDSLESSDSSYIPTVESSSSFVLSPPSIDDGDHIVKFLHSNVVQSLLTATERESKQQLCRNLYSEAVQWHKALLSSKSMLSYPPLADKKGSLKFYLKWSKTQPGLLIQLLQTISHPLLFLRQLSKTSLLEFGEYAYSVKVMDMLNVMVKRSSNGDFTKFLKHWHSVIALAATSRSAYIAATARHRWTRMAGFATGLRKHIASIESLEILQIAALMDLVFDRLFSVIEINEVYSTKLSLERHKSLFAISALLNAHPDVRRVLNNALHADWSSARRLMIQLQWPGSVLAPAQRC